MRHQPLFAIAVFFACSAQAAPLPGDPVAGKRLHDAHCTGCHDTAVYTRADHSVRSLAALERQFQACSHMANTEFTPAQAQDVIKYLNDEFYGFRRGAE